MQLRPELLPPPVPAERIAHLAAAITRDEVVEIARRITAGPGPQADDPDAGWYTLVLDTDITMPAASSLLFHPPSELGPEPTPEQIVDFALAYRPGPL